MSGRAARAASTLFAALGLVAVMATAAHAELALGSCKDNIDFACGHLSVPLNPAEPAGPTISLAVRRHRAPVGQAHSAIIALAGGPGQAAIPIAQEVALEVLGSVADDRDLLVFDQRGTGASDPLHCKALRHVGADEPESRAVAHCAAQLGSARSFFTTADSVADIEALRRAGGYEKLVLYGTSYGTKVAEEYAAEYPEHVEALVLDSVVTPAGPDTLYQPTFEAIPRILRQICARGECAGVTSNPVADLRRVLVRMSGRPLRGRVFRAGGASGEISVTREDILDLLLEGDFSNLLRGQLVTALHAAAEGDSSPLARLWSVVGSAGEGDSAEFDLPLYYATTCEEEDFPWNRGAVAATRIAEALTAARAERSAFLPFSPRDAIAFSDVPACAGWPYPAEPTATASSLPALPNVPTLILSGADDLRTPTANARAVAGEIPDAQVVVVPYTGHSVLGEEPGECAAHALQAFFASKPIKSCSKDLPPAELRPPALPVSLARLAPLHGYAGQTGRALRAIRLTLADTTDELALRLESGAFEDLAADPRIDIGGLRSGWAQIGNDGLQLHGYSFIEGVSLSGIVDLQHTRLEVRGPEGIDGVLRAGAKGALVGQLGGANVELPARTLAAAAIVGPHASAAAYLDRAGARLAADALPRQRRG